MREKNTCFYCMFYQYLNWEKTGACVNERAKSMVNHEGTMFYTHKDFLCNQFIAKLNKLKENS